MILTLKEIGRKIKDIVMSLECKNYRRVNIPSV